MTPITLAILLISSLITIAAIAHRDILLIRILKIKPIIIVPEPVYVTTIGSIENEMMSMILYYTAYLQNEDKPLEYPIRQVFEYYGKKRDQNLDSYIVFDGQLCFISNWDSVPITQSLLDMHLNMLRSINLIP